MNSLSALEAIFLAALDKSSAADRAAYLDEACAHDPELRRQLDRLLNAQAKAGNFLQNAVPRLAGTIDLQPPEQPGTTIGPYKLLQQIGEGGMGVVYMAEQQEPVRRKVALKIIKPGMDSRQVIARFEAERQALALMDHPNIAGVLDAGTIPGEPGTIPGEPGCVSAGRPYFVMELVHGVPITQFCDDHNLTPRERLALFVPVCQAIQHAHQKGIIHRDVKPSNVLVTLYDDKPVPKVIDFGVAKAIEQRLTEKSLFTQFGALVGTFEYMSPEQAEMNALGVDTRSDIYSLGVLLYELLTGTTPLERTRLREAALNELVRLIKEEEAPRPSVRLSTSNNLPKIAAARKTEPARLSKLVRGEIDWIVMKCLEKNRTRRYDTASGLARDVERYLADEPVEACPPSAAYRLSKLARKYQKALVTAAAFALLLVAGVVLSTLLAVWATSAESEANRQRSASEAAQREALQAKGEADNQRDEARRTAYAAGLGLAQRAWQENNVVRARELLDEVPREAAGRDLRGFEWYYLSRLCHSETRTLRGHTNAVSSVAFNPDGWRLASGSHDSTVKVWDSATGKELWSHKDQEHVVTSVVFSPDGRRLAAASEGVKVWDSATGKELLSLKGHKNVVTSVAFSPNGRRLAASAGERVQIWDSATGKELLSLESPADQVNSVAFSPDGRRLAAACGHTVLIWDSATGKEVFSLEGQFVPVTSVAFSPDGRRLAASQDRTVNVWDSVTGKELFSLEGPSSGITSVAFSPDGGRLAAASFDWTVRLWDTATGAELSTLKGHDHAVTSVAFSPDGQRLVSGGHDLTVKIWDSEAGKESFALKGSANGVSPANGVNSVAFSPDGRRLAAACAGHKVLIWDSATGKELLSLKSPFIDDVPCVAFSPNGRRLAASGGDCVQVWDSTTGKELFSLGGPSNVIARVAFSPDGRRLAAGFDKTVKIWDSATGKELLSLAKNAHLVVSVAFSPDGRRLATAGFDKTVRIWDSATGQELLTLQGHTGVIRSVAFSPNGRLLASGSEDKTVKVWDSATGREVFSLKGHHYSVNSVAFSPDGRRLASGSWTIKIWDSATGKELFSLQGPGDIVTSVAFSPDGRRLAASGNRDNSIYLWETSVAPAVQDHRAAAQLVAALFRQKGLRTDVLQWLQTVPGMSPSRRQEALALAQTHPEDPAVLHVLARELVKLPGRERADYRQALSYSEAACQLKPKNGPYWTMLGMAHYRVGNYEKALEMLLRSQPINEKVFQGSFPADHAFLAMTHHRLGHAQQAQAEFQCLRQRLKEPRWAQDADAQSFLGEAEALLAKPKAPGGK